MASCAVKVGIFTLSLPLLVSALRHNSPVDQTSEEFEAAERARIQLNEILAASLEKLKRCTNATCDARPVWEGCREITYEVSQGDKNRKKYVQDHINGGMGIDGIHLVLEAIKNFPANPDILSACYDALGNAVNFNRDATLAAGKEAAVAASIDSMTRFHDHKLVVQSASLMLGCMADNSPKYTAQMRELGALDLAIDAVYKFPESWKAWGGVCGMSADKDNAAIEIERGIIGLTNAVMRNDTLRYRLRIEPEILNLWGSMAMRGYGNELTSIGAKELALDAMRRAPGNREIQAAGKVIVASANPVINRVERVNAYGVQQLKHVGAHLR